MPRCRQNCAAILQILLALLNDLRAALERGQEKWKNIAGCKSSHRGQLA